MSKATRVQKRLFQQLAADQCKIADFYSRVAQALGEAKGMATIDDADMDEPGSELEEPHDREVCDDDRLENHINQYDTCEDEKDEEDLDEDDFENDLLGNHIDQYDTYEDEDEDEDHVDEEDEFEDDFSMYNSDED